jgi:hypothetical protein
LLALALFKLQLVLPVASILSVRRSTRSVSGFATVAIPLAVLCVAIVGLQGTADFLHLLSMASLASNDSAEVQQFMAIPAKAMPSLYGLLYVCGARFLPASLAFGLNAAISIVLLVFCFYLARRVVHTSTAFSVAILGALILSQHLLIYDFTLLLLPILLLRGPALPWITALCYAMPFVLFAIEGVKLFSLAAVVPILLLGTCMGDLGRHLDHDLQSTRMRTQAGPELP